MEIHARFGPNGLRVVGRAASSVDLRVPGVLLIALGAAFLIVTMLAASMAPAYDFHGGKISDLGVIPETALLFNSLMVAVGVLNLAGGWLLYRAARRWWLLAPFVLAGVGAAGVGLFPLDTGTPHSLFALLAFVCFNVEALATAAIVRGPMRWTSVIAGLVGLAFVGVMIVGDGGNAAAFGAIGHGGAERMIAYPVMAWLLAIGGFLVAGPSLDVADRPIER